MNGGKDIRVRAAFSLTMAWEHGGGQAFMALRICSATWGTMALPRAVILCALLGIRGTSLPNKGLSAHFSLGTAGVRMLANRSLLKIPAPLLCCGLALPRSDSPAHIKSATMNVRSLRCPKEIPVGKLFHSASAPLSARSPRTLPIPRPSKAATFSTIAYLGRTKRMARTI